MRDHQFKGNYCCIYPIKVNQQRQVVEEVLGFGRPYRFGLEAGSKPELLAVIAMASNDTPIICNGFKDHEFIEMAMLAQKIGRQIIPVVEKYTELESDFRATPRRSACAPISASASSSPREAGGRWQGSARLPLQVRTDGQRNPPRARRAEATPNAGLLQAAAFPLGQPDHQYPPYQAGAERSRPASMPSWQPGAGLEYLDVGGGLGVDYDGSQTNFESSMNYTLQEYANDVVFHIQSVCDDAGVPHPMIFSESGRAIVAYHSALVFNVLGVSGRRESDVPNGLPNDVEQPLPTCYDALQFDARNVLESYHDAQQALDMTMHLFGGGYCRWSSGARPRTCFGPSAARSTSWSVRWTTCPRNWKSWMCCSARPISAISRSSSRCPIVGRSSSFFP